MHLSEVDVATAEDVILIGAIMLELFGWVGISMNGLNMTVTKMSANVDQLQKSIADLQQTQGTAAQRLSDIRNTNTRQDARDDAIEADEEGQGPTATCRRPEAASGCRR